MSFEAYKLAVAISLTENVTRGLSAMSVHFAKANSDAVALNNQIEKIGKNAMLGGLLAGAGVSGLKLFDKPLEKAIEYERQIARLRQQGLGDNQIDDAKKFSDAQKVIGQSRLDMIRHFTEAQGAFRESGMEGEHALYAAKIMTPVLAQYEAASEMLSGHTKAAAHQAMLNLNKTVEIMGGINDPKRAVDIADGIFRAVQSSGRMIDERQLKQFVAYGSSATNSMDMRAIFGGLEPIIGEFGGSTVATGLRTAFTRMSGAMALPPKKMQGILSELGIGVIDHGSFRLNDQLLSLMQKDSVAFAKKMMTIYGAHGITSDLDQERANAQLFGTNGAKIYNKIMSQMPTIEASLKAYDKALNPTQTLNTPEGKRLASIQDYQKKIEDLQLVLAKNGGLLDVFTKGLVLLGRAIERVTTFAKEHPTLTKLAVMGFVAISVLAVLAGGFLLLNSALIALKLMPTVGAVGELGASLGGMLGPIARLKSSAIPALLGGLKSLAAKMPQFFTALGAFMPQAVAGAIAFAAGYAIGEQLNKLLSKETRDGIGDAGMRVLSFLDIGDARKLVHQKSGGELYKNQGYENSGVSLTPEARARLVEMEKKNYIVPAGGGKQQAINNTIVMPDGRVLASVVTEVQAREANRPGMGAPTFDPTMGAIPVGLGYSR